MTLLSNDYEYDSVFERQIEALASNNDLLIGIFTSGNSENVLRAFTKGKDIGCRTIGFSGNDGGKMNDLCDLNIIIPSNNTPRIQEMHTIIGHIICSAIDNMF